MTRVATIVLSTLLVATIAVTGCTTTADVPLAVSDLDPAALEARGVPTQWELVFHDEFSGTALKEHWTRQVNAWGGGNNELQYYTARDENAYVRGGKLHIVARKEYYEGTEGARAYTSARLTTEESVDWQYGRFEFRARLPEGQGIWPAIWMLPTEEAYGTWAASGEVDIMELVGHIPGRVHGTLHYGNQWPLNVHSGHYYQIPGGGRFSEAFHTFTLIWQADAFHWYVDGRHYQTQTAWYTEEHEFPAPFDQRFHLILNVAVGGNWPGPPDDTTVFPQELVIDYIRVYKAL